MRRDLVDVLADPVSGKALELVVEDADGDDVERGWLLSPSGHRYPIAGGIPRFTSAGYSGSFGLQWNRFARVQLDSATGARYSRRRFDETGWQPHDLAGRWVLDAGCGAGRFAEVAAGYGAEVLAVDLSGAVDAVRANLGHLGNVHPIQADLRRLPIRPDVVERAFSLGVLQHTPEPAQATRGLVEFLTPGAHFAFTIYGRKPWTRLHSKYWLRPLTRRLPPGVLLRCIEAAMPVLFPVTDVLFRAPVVGRLFQFVIPVANYTSRRELPRDLRYEEAVLDTFDMLAPRYDRPVTRAEIARALQGIAERVDFASTVPVIVRGVRSGREPRTRTLP